MPAFWDVVLYSLKKVIEILEDLTARNITQMSVVCVERLWFAWE